MFRKFISWSFLASYQNFWCFIFCSKFQIWQMEKSWYDEIVQQSANQLILSRASILGEDSIKMLDVNLLWIWCLTQPILRSYWSYCNEGTFWITISGSRMSRVMLPYNNPQNIVWNANWPNLAGKLSWKDGCWNINSNITDILTLDHVELSKLRVNRVDEGEDD